MQQRHIAVFTPFVGGHVAPALGVCAELISRGHRVTYPTNENYASRIRDVGATPLELTTPQFKHVEKIIDEEEPDGPKYWRAFTSVIGPTMLATAAVTVAEVEKYYTTNPPDLILYDWFAFAGRILARQLGCPTIQIHSHFAHQESLMRVEGGYTTPESMLGYAKLLDSFMATYGFADKNHLWHYEKLNIFCIPRSFQYGLDAFDSRFKFVGATHNRKPRAGVWQKDAVNGEPLVLISEATSSTDGAFLRMCIEALAESKYYVVVSKAPNSPEITPVPSNFTINRGVFNCEILPLSNVMLCQGGMGTTLESLYHGVPVVALPPNMFNSEVAYRMEELGLGVHVRPRHVTPGKLRGAVDIASSDEAMLSRVKLMQSDLASDPPGPAVAADIIEDYLARL